MSISGALHNALSGLTANSRLAEITSNNLANALTPGYGRQSAEISAAVAGGHGSGVIAGQVTRSADPALTEARRQADGALAAADAGLAALSGIEAIFGKPGEAGSLMARLTAFEAGLRDLADTPESAPRQSAAVEAARDLVAGFTAASGRLDAIRTRADGDIARSVTALNDSLDQIARLNRRIQVFTAAGRNTASLVDERARQIDSVSAALPTRLTEHDDGTIELRTAEGMPLAHLRPRTIAFTPTPVVTAEQTYDGGTGALGGLSIDGVDITPGGTGPQRIRGGTLAGLFETRDVTAATARTRLDALAAELVGRFEAPGLSDAGLGLFTDRGSPLDPARTAGLAGRLALSAAVDPAAGGDPARLRDGLGAIAPGPLSADTLPRDLLDALTARSPAAGVPGLAGTLSLADQLAQVVELTATDRVQREDRVAALAAAREAVATEEADRIGVDQDAELQMLIQLQQAYQANVQVIQAAEAMLDALMEL